MINKQIFFKGWLQVGLVACGLFQMSCTTSSVASRNTGTPFSNGFYSVALNSFYPAEPDVNLKNRARVLPRGKKGYPTYPDTVRHRFVRTTAYSDKENEPGAPGNFNAAGTRLKYTTTVRSAAADWSVYPVGTKFRIKGLPYVYIVDDYGSALVGSNTIDIYHPSLSLMNRWGTRTAEIQVIQWGSWARSERLLRGRRKYPHCRKMHTVLQRKIAAGVIAKTGQSQPSQPLNSPYRLGLKERHW